MTAGLSVIKAAQEHDGEKADCHFMAVKQVALTFILRLHNVGDLADGKSEPANASAVLYLTF